MQSQFKLKKVCSSGFILLILSGEQCSFQTFAHSKQNVSCCCYKGRGCVCDSSLLTLLAPGLCCLKEVHAEVTFGLVSSRTGGTLATLTVSGHLSLKRSYQPENDIPEQRQALENLYNATAGRNWLAAYSTTYNLDWVRAFRDDHPPHNGKFRIRSSLQLCLQT